MGQDSQFHIRTGHINDIHDIQRIAKPAWQTTYGPILSSDQLQYMLNLIYNSEALKQVIENKEQEFIVVEHNKNTIGFAAFSQRPSHPDVYKLHKLYLLPSEKGKGIGKALLKEVQHRCKQYGARLLELNVNRYNASKDFYQAMGFEVVYEEDVPIGPYFMNDYVMRKSLEGVFKKLCHLLSKRSSNVATRSFLIEGQEKIVPDHLVCAFIVARYICLMIAFSEAKAPFVLVTFRTILW